MIDNVGGALQMRLYLIQHGDAVAKDVDPDRPLSQKGWGDIERLAAYVSKVGLRATRIIHSGKTRASQTAELLTPAFGVHGDAVAQEGLNPKDAPTQIMEELASQPENTVIVGHMPSLGRLAAALLTCDDSDSVVGSLPGTLIGLERTEQGGWCLICMLRPEHY